MLLQKTENKTNLIILIKIEGNAASSFPRLVSASLIKPSSLFTCISSSLLSLLSVLFIELWSRRVNPPPLTVPPSLPLLLFSFHPPLLSSFPLFPLSLPSLLPCQLLFPTPSFVPFSPSSPSLLPCFLTAFLSSTPLHFPLPYFPHSSSLPPCFSPFHAPSFLPFTSLPFSFLLWSIISSSSASHTSCLASYYLLSSTSFISALLTPFVTFLLPNFPSPYILN